MRNVGVARDPQVNMARHAQSMPPPASHGPLLDKYAMIHFGGKWAKKNLWSCFIAIDVVSA